jgi:hypothetical protein
MALQLRQRSGAGQHGAGAAAGSLAGGRYHITFATACPLAGRSASAPQAHRLARGCTHWAQRSGTSPLSPWPTWPRQVHLSPSQFAARCRENKGLAAPWRLAAQPAPGAGQAAARPGHAGGRGGTPPRATALPSALAPRCAAPQAAKAQCPIARLSDARHGRHNHRSATMFGAARRCPAKRITVGLHVKLLPCQANLYALGAIALWAVARLAGRHAAPCAAIFADRHCAGDRQRAGLAAGGCATRGCGPLRRPRWRWAFTACSATTSCCSLRCASRRGGGQPGQLPVAAVHRGAGARVPAGVTLRAAHVVAALVGFGGAAIAILGARDGTGGGWPGATCWRWARPSSGPAIRC